MLKQITVGHQELPVPVPLYTLEDALTWVDKTLVPQDALVTKIELDGHDVLEASKEEMRSISLSKQSNLCIQVESPWDLAIKTLDAVRELSDSIEKTLKEIAVKCWSLTSDLPYSKVRETSNDLELIQDLINHINGILDYSQKEMAPINGISRLIRRPLSDLQDSIKKCEWKQCSYILLNRIEPLLRDLVIETEGLQISILTSKKIADTQECSP